MKIEFELIIFFYFTKRLSLHHVKILAIIASTQIDITFFPSTYLILLHILQNSLGHFAFLAFYPLFLLVFYQHHFLLNIRLQYFLCFASRVFVKGVG